LIEDERGSWELLVGLVVFIIRKIGVMIMVYKIKYVIVMRGDEHLIKANIQPMCPIDE
jgi:hypothetical protein